MDIFESPASPHAKDPTGMHRTAPLPIADQAADGVLHCLRLLAEEAAGLGLARTHVAICQVLRICEAERTPPALGDPPRLVQ